MSNRTMKELRADMYNSYYYMILKNITSKGKVIDGWEFDVEPMVGTFVFTKQFPTQEISVYATPFWEGEYGVTVQQTNWEGEFRDVTRFAVIPCGDSKKDCDEYFEVMTDILKSCEPEDWDISDDFDDAFLMAGDSNYGR